MVGEWEDKFSDLQYVDKVHSISILLFPDSHLIRQSGKESVVNDLTNKATMGATKIANSSDLPIEICDEVEETNEVKKCSLGRQTRRDTRIQEKDFLCEFPPGESPSVAVTYQDYKTLEHNTWLNDIIIDFFLAWLYKKVLPEEDRARVHMFTTMFYRYLLHLSISFLI